MKHYEHRLVPWHGADITEVASNLGPEWVFCGEHTDKSWADPSGGFWRREVRGDDDKALLSALATRVRVGASSPLPPLELDDIADVLAAMASGEPVDINWADGTKIRNELTGPA